MPLPERMKPTNVSRADDKKKTNNCVFLFFKGITAIQTARTLPFVLLIPIFLVACSHVKPADSQKPRIQDNVPVTSAATLPRSLIIEKHAPYYPVKAAALKLSGAVTVRYDITTEGLVDNARIIYSTPPDVFDREVLNATRKWRFKPNHPVVNVEEQVRFEVGSAVQ